MCIGPSPRREVGHDAAFSAVARGQLLEGLQHARGLGGAAAISPSRVIRRLPFIAHDREHRAILDAGRFAGAASRLFPRCGPRRAPPCIRFDVRCVGVMARSASAGPRPGAASGARRRGSG